MDTSKNVREYMIFVEDVRQGKYTKHKPRQDLRQEHRRLGYEKENDR